MTTLMGMPVRISQDQPKLQIRSDFEWITDTQRKKTNDWLAATFGYNTEGNLIKDGNVIQIGVAPNVVLVMNPRTYANMQAAIRKTLIEQCDKFNQHRGSRFL